LLFAPSYGKKWQAFIKRLKLEGEVELLDFAKKLRLKEVAMVKVNAEELWELARQEGALTLSWLLLLSQDLVTMSTGYWMSRVATTAVRAVHLGDYPSTLV
jgi:hypothetical protein